MPTNNSTSLVDRDWLDAHHTDPSVRVVEVDVSATTYERGHIAGAVLWNVYADLKDSDYHLVGPGEVRRLFERSGIEPSSTVVFYGYAAALGFWLMKLYGHPGVAILDSDRDSWLGEGRPWSDETAVPAPTVYPLQTEDGAIRATAATVRDAIGGAGGPLLDVRTDAEFSGERFWPSGGMEPGGRAGHVPTAVHAPLDGMYGTDGSFRERAELAAILPGGDGAITYCTIGGRAATAWFVLSELLGHDGVRVYDGSWAEWGRMADTPVAAGEVSAARRSEGAG
jgi:thiosulfate/3-mercaptopyruvate sulfurtransferase